MHTLVRGKLTDKDIYMLKGRAKQMKKLENITHTAALHKLAAELGYKNWEMLLAENHITTGD